MKVTSAAALFLAFSPAFAQTKPAIHHTAVKKPVTAAAACATATPTLAATIPKVTGCPTPMYALSFVDTLVGTGTAVTSRKWLTVAYTGYLVDGTKFDSSIGKDPITFPYGARKVIPGWDTGFEGMHIGGKRRLFVPYQLAYGEDGRPPVIPQKAELIFDVELINISDTPPAPATPPTPATPPAGSAPSTPPPTAPSSTPGTTPGTAGKPAPDGARPAPPAPTTDPTKPTATPPKP